MSARLFIVVFSLLQLLYFAFKCIVIDIQRKKPLPEEVSDIYDATRYETYLNYAKDNRRFSFMMKCISLFLLVILTYSNMYETIEKICNGNVYAIYFLTYGVYFVVESIEAYLLQYYDTFHIEEKYGFNKKDKKEFHKDFLLDVGSECILTSVLSLLLIFIGEHLPIWTHHFTLKPHIIVGICAGIVFVLFLFVLFANFLSLWVLKKQYHFTPLEEGELKNKIMALQEGAKKKVVKINVYDESKKSTSKNAFLLRFLWIKEFGIADNFMNENAQDELLAVLSHEIGHLKHKKNLFDFMGYIFGVILFVLFVCLLCNICYVDMLMTWIYSSFDISVNNYYVNIAIFTNLLTPFMYLFSVYRNNNIRMQEYEADEEAVKNGYGDALIATFKKMSSDELVNVNPSLIIEFLEYDHPGMYRRIKAIIDSSEKIGHL